MNGADQNPTDNAFVGQVLEGAYRLTRLIGEGGMGAVYEAVQLRLGKHVAVKLLSRDLSANQEALARFRREAEVTSQLGHPHIVSVFDFGAAASGEPYLVMEMLAGEDLERRLRRVGRLPLPEAIRICKQVASALAATHAKDIIHRDLKPANIFLVKLQDDDDFVKVLDFGISKAKAAVTKLTRASQVMGTPHYMAPEQATGQIDEIDTRTDQWSLACIVWEMLGGRGPFVGDDVASLLYQVVHQDPAPLAAKVPGLPPSVEKVLRRGISKKQADRFPSVLAFTSALEAAATGRSEVIETRLGTPVRPPVAAKQTMHYGAPSVPGHFEGADPELPEEFAATVIRTTQHVPARAAKTPMPTTFSRTAAEVGGPITGVRRIRPVWAVGAGAVALLVVLVSIFALSGRRGGTSSATGSAGQPSPLPSPPVAEHQGPTLPTITPTPSAPTAIPVVAPKVSGRSARRATGIGTDRLANPFSSDPNAEPTRPKSRKSAAKKKGSFVDDL